MKHSGSRFIWPALVALVASQLSLAGSAAEQPSETASQEPQKVSYYRDVRPILQQHCQGCHQPAMPSGGLVMTSYPDLLKAGDTQMPGIVPGDADQSAIVMQITSLGGEAPAMPKGKPPLSETEVNVVTRWIVEGAIDDTPETAREVIDMEHPPVYELPPVLTSLAFSPDGALLAVSGDHEVLLHKADGSELVARLVGLSERVESIAFSPDGKRLAVAAGSPYRFGELQVWDVAEKRLDFALTVTFDSIYGVSWSRDGSMIAFGCADNTVRAVDSQTGKQVLFQGAHADWVLDTVFSTDASHLVSVSRDRSMKLTEVATQRFVDNVTSITPGALKGGLQVVARHPAKDELLIGGADGTPKIYQMYRTKARQIGDDFNLIRQFDSMPGRIFAADYSPAGDWVVVGSSYNGVGEVRVYQEADAKLVSKFEGQHGGVYTLSVSPDGNAVASGGFDGVVRLNDPRTGRLIKEFFAAPLKTTEAVALQSP